MAVISIKRYLDLPSSDAYLRMFEILVEVITEHPVDIDHVECERFKSEVAKIQERFGGEPTREQFVQAVTAIRQVLERHNRSVGNLVRSQGSEMQNMVAMLTHTIKSLGSASETSSRNLESIATQLKRASAVEDIYQLRMQLAECLRNVRDEAVRQRAESQNNLQSMEQQLTESQQRLANHGIEIDIDRVTGFAGRSAAEVAIHEAVDAGDAVYIAVAVLARMESINARFGYAVGDEVLCEFAARVAGRLCSRAAFYRWSGPTIIGILQRSEPIHVIRTEVSRVAEAPISKALVTGSQNAFITMSASSMVLPVAPPASDIIARIDRFVAGQIPAEFSQVPLN